MIAITRSAALATLLGASAAFAQLPSIPGFSLSSSCSTALVGVLTTGNITQCLPLASPLPVLTSSSPIIPALDTFMTDICYTLPPCTNATLTAAAATIAKGCASDAMNLTSFNSDGLVMSALEAYPVIREVLCLKTSDPYSNTSSAGFLGPAPIPIGPAYNSTNGTFCVTSVLTQLSAYFGTNLTLPYITSIVSGTNMTGAADLKNISTTVLCNDCIFAAVDVVEAAYPALGSMTVAQLAGVFNISSTSNATINGVLNSTCAYENLTASTNGTLPANITVSIVNSTFGYNLTNGNMTFPAATVNSTMMKRIFGY